MEIENKIEKFLNEVRGNDNQYPNNSTVSAIKNFKVNGNIGDITTDEEWFVVSLESDSVILQSTNDRTRRIRMSKQEYSQLFKDN